MKKTCKLCGIELGKWQRSFCCNEHKHLYFNHQRFPNGSEYVECKECGIRAKDLVSHHIVKVHHMTVEQYCEKHNCTRYDLITKSLHEKKSSISTQLAADGKCGWQKGGKNPSYDEECRSGRRSPWSMNYRGYDGLTNEEKLVKIAELSERAQKTMNDNHNNPLRIDFYTFRGATEEEARQMLAERQCTFSFEKCIEKFGVKEGRRVFRERQEKWQATLDAKPQEEKDRINKAKARSISNICGYSEISQKLFRQVFDVIKNDYTDIYFATYDKNKENSNKNFEYEVILEDEIHRFFLDFYVKDNNKVIEFDGDYWHGEKRGNQKREQERENKLKQLGFVNIMHVKECDYNTDPQKVVDKCIRFIKE